MFRRHTGKEFAVKWCLDCGEAFDQNTHTGEPEACPECGSAEYADEDEVNSYLVENAADDKRRGETSA